MPRRTRKNQRRAAAEGQRAARQQRRTAESLHETFDGRVEASVVEEVLAASGGDAEAAFTALFAMTEAAPRAATRHPHHLDSPGGGGGGGPAAPAPVAATVSGTIRLSGGGSSPTAEAAAATAADASEPPTVAAGGAGEACADDSPEAAWSQLVEIFANGDAADLSVDELMDVFERAKGDIVEATDAILERMAAPADEESAVDDSSSGGSDDEVAAVPPPPPIALPARDISREWPSLEGSDGVAKGPVLPFGGGAWRERHVSSMVGVVGRVIDPSVIEDVLVTCGNDAHKAEAMLTDIYPSEMASARAIARAEAAETRAHDSLRRAAPAVPAEARGAGAGSASSDFLDHWLSSSAHSAAAAADEARAADARMRSLFAQAARAHKGMHPAAAGEYARQARELRAKRVSAGHVAATAVFRARNPSLTRRQFSGASGRFPPVDCHGLAVDDCLLLARQLIRHAAQVRVRDVTIITGVGRHSKRGVARLRPTLRRMLDAAGVSHTYSEGKFAIRVDPDRTVV